jgi:hypothetical protein
MCEAQFSGIERGYFQSLTPIGREYTQLLRNASLSATDTSLAGFSRANSWPIKSTAARAVSGDEHPARVMALPATAVSALLVRGFIVKSNTVYGFAHHLPTPTCARIASASAQRRCRQWPPHGLPYSFRHPPVHWAPPGPRHPRSTPIAWRGKWQALPLEDIFQPIPRLVVS